MPMQRPHIVKITSEYDPIGEITEHTVKIIECPGVQDALRFFGPITSLKPEEIEQLDVVNDYDELVLRGKTFAVIDGQWSELMEDECGACEWWADDSSLVEGLIEKLQESREDDLSGTYAITFWWADETSLTIDTVKKIKED